MQGIGCTFCCNLQSAKITATFAPKAQSILNFKTPKPSVFEQQHSKSIA